METNIKNTATLIHLSSLSQYFIPFGNFILPLIIWSSTKDKSEYVDAQGKQVINFQLSLFLYTVILSLIAIPIIVVTLLKNTSFIEAINDHSIGKHYFSFENISGTVFIALIAILIFGFMKIIEFFLIIYGSVKASNGENFKYPLTIPFIK